MPDITMCNNKNCRLRDVCYRFKAVPSQRQSYAHFAPDADGKCEHFTPTSMSDNDRSKHEAACKHE